MNAVYPTIYRDRRGEERTSIRNDGVVLSTTLRGVEFRGADFDSLEPVEPLDSAQASSFTLHWNCLCSCRLEIVMPIAVVTARGPVEGALHAQLELGGPTPNGRVDLERLTLRLEYDKESLTSAAREASFEDQLIDIQRRLPSDTYVRSCINCAYSDYSPLGHGLFGGLACFRDNKVAYSQVEGKDGLFAIWDTMTEFVQETFLCPEFEIREPGTGYRG